MGGVRTVVESGRLTASARLVRWDWLGRVSSRIEDVQKPGEVPGLVGLRTALVVGREGWVEARLVAPITAEL